MCSARRVTVQFYVYKSVHWPMFEALYEYLTGRPEVREIILCLPSLALLSNGRSYALVETLLAKGVTITTHPAEKPVDITFIADTVAGRVKGCGVVVNVGHGTISKGYYFTDSVWTERENWADLLCVPGAYAESRFAHVLRTRVVATGMPKLDPVFSGEHTRDALCRTYDVDPADRLVLYAPTFNEQLSSVYLFAERFHELARPGRTVFIKLHGSTKSVAVEQYRELARTTPGFVFVEDPNIAPCLGGADVLVSDVSSVVMEFMALDKPVVLFNHPEMRRYHGFNAEDIEHKWRHLATEAGSFEELSLALDRVLHHGDDKSAVRRGYAAELFADRTGHAAERVWQAALEACAAGPIHSQAVPTVSLVAMVTPENLFLMRRALWQAQFYAVMPMELLLLQLGSTPELDAFVKGLEAFPSFLSVRVTRLRDAAGADAALGDTISQARGEFVLITRDDVVLNRGFDYFFHKAFQARSDVDALTGLCDAPGAADYRRFARESVEGAPGDRLAYQFINWYGAADVVDFQAPGPPPLTMVRRRALVADRRPLGACLVDLATRGRIKLAPSVFYALIPKPHVTLLRAYLRATGLDRLRLAKEVLASGYYAIFPDIGEGLVRDLLGVNSTAAELEPVVSFYSSQRDTDLAGLKRMRNTLRKRPALAAALDAQIRVVGQIRERSARGRVGEPTGGGAVPSACHRSSVSARPLQEASGGGLQHA